MRQRDRDGYGIFSVDTRPVKAHRYSYTRLVGTISADMTIDHLCRVKSCVNPQHLEVVTRRENVLRSKTPASRVYRQTHCPAGGHVRKTVELVGYSQSMSESLQPTQNVCVECLHEIAGACDESPVVSADTSK
ncbi:HNH endonuclease signature motif containing protein [Rhodococcus sp. ARC_M12]|uniref:HNH endonuclease signature motif containing protein n=1 Tax=Rhodococcus sp. ARC_M12 TaxID=2928854 RepID=UPI0035AD834F